MTDIKMCSTQFRNHTRYCLPSVPYNQPQKRLLLILLNACPIARGCDSQVWLCCECGLVLSFLSFLSKSRARSERPADRDCMPCGDTSRLLAGLKGSFESGKASLRVSVLSTGDREGEDPKPACTVIVRGTRLPLGLKGTGLDQSQERDEPSGYDEPQGL